jgi:alpha-beta hydrolase superfamily lysophospholipase
MFTQLNKNKRAIWYPVTGVKKIKGTILFLPGFPKYPSHSEFITFFNKEGYDVLVVMYSGTFDSSGGFSIENSMQDANFWYDFLKKETIQYGPAKTQRIKHKSIIMFSTSFGGLIAGLALKKYAFPEIQKCIFVSPLWDMGTYKDNKLNLQIADETSEIMSFAYPFSYRFKNKQHFFRQIKGLAPIPNMNRQFVDQQKKYIVFCGREDKVTPLMMSEVFTSVYKNSKLNILGGGHSSKIDLKKFIKLTKENI